MGSLISLGLGRFEVEWGKNSFFRNHSKLFLPTDIKPVTYFYGGGQTEQKPAYARKLGSVAKRLELLGFTLSECRQLYEDIAKSHSYEDSEKPFPFDMFGRAVSAVNVDQIGLPVDDDDPDYDYAYLDFGEFVVENIFRDPEFAKTSEDFGALRKWDGEFYENLDPYIVLRLLAENPRNLDRELSWQFADVVENGWANQDSLYEGLSDADRILIVTEGSTDTTILKKTLPLLAPDVADFFTFVDMKENYPFAGTGNVTKFCRGLARIRVQNRIVVVLDNDTAGLEAYQVITKLELPPRMRIMTLPNLEEASQFPTLGPGGRAVEDINGRAVSIECFLDLNFGASDNPTVRWSSYNSNLGSYQGSLINKDDYVGTFFDSVGRDKRYDLSKLSVLWSCILKNCIGH